jgi:hypothetical protein
MVLSIASTVTVGFGATYHFQLLFPPPRVTKLLAQIGATADQQKIFLMD